MQIQNDATTIAIGADSPRFDVVYGRAVRIVDRIGSGRNQSNYCNSKNINLQFKGAEMDFVVQKSRIGGRVRMPGSKSHTIRGLIMGALAGGESRLREPLDSRDTRSCLRFVEALGAGVDASAPGVWVIEGTAGRLRPAKAADVGNSGTTLFLGMAAAATGRELLEITGDEQTRRRDAGPLLDALSALGATAYSRGGDGSAPLVVGGGLQGGAVAIECPTSQYLSALLIACPLARSTSHIRVPLLYEKPYVEMTLRWLSDLGIELEHEAGYGSFTVPGRQHYAGFDICVPADFSSATFFLLAAAVCGGEVVLGGLDISDSQGDREVVWMFQRMGCEIELLPDAIAIKGPEALRGGEFDLNATPDALPAMAVAGALAEGRTRLVNVPQARIKETDRIRVMAQELGRMGARVEELDDGLVIEGGSLHGANLSGHGDHRIVMALSVAGMAACGPTRIDAAEAVAVTFPGFQELMRHLGADIVLHGGVDLT